MTAARTLRSRASSRSICRFSTFQARNHANSSTATAASTYGSRVTIVSIEAAWPSLAGLVPGDHGQHHEASQQAAACEPGDEEQRHGRERGAFGHRGRIDDLE